MLAARTGDGRIDVEPFPRATTSASGASWLRSTRTSRPVRDGQPLTLGSPDQFPTEGMPALTSAQYAAEFNEVKALGAQSGSSRTEAQTLMAGFSGQSALLLQHRAPRHRDGRGIVDERTGSPVRQDEHGGSGRAHQLLEQQEALVRVATADGDPRSGERRQSAHRAGPELDVALRGAGLPGRAVRLQLLHGRVLAQRPVLLRHRQVRVLADQSRRAGQRRRPETPSASPGQPGPTGGSPMSSTTPSTAGSSTASTSGPPTCTAPGSARRRPSGSTSTTSRPSTDGPLKPTPRSFGEDRGVFLCAECPDRFASGSNVEA